MGMPCFSVEIKFRLFHLGSLKLCGIVVDYVPSEEVTNIVSVSANFPQEQSIDYPRLGDEARDSPTKSQPLIEQLTPQPVQDRAREYGGGRKGGMQEVVDPSGTHAGVLADAMETERMVKAMAQANQGVLQLLEDPPNDSDTESENCVGKDDSSNEHASFDSQEDLRKKRKYPEPKKRTPVHLRHSTASNTRSAVAKLPSDSACTGKGVTRGHEPKKSKSQKKADKRRKSQKTT